MLIKRNRSPNWSARFQIDGKEYLLSTGTADKAQAKRWEADAKIRIRAEGKANAAAARSPLTVETATGRYWHESGQYQKGKDVLRHMTWLRDRLGAKQHLRDITSREVAAIIAQRRAEGVSNATVNRSVIEPLRRVMNRARDIWNEPVQKIEWGKLKLREPTGIKREASYDQERAILDHIRPEYQPAIRFALLTGFRRSEVCALRWRDVDWQSNLISVLGKGDKHETIPMTPSIAEVLRPLRGQHFDFVFTFIRRRALNGEPVGARAPIPSNNLYVIFKRAARAAGLGHIRVHDLRHTAGSRVTRAGGLNVTKQLLRHNDIKTTLRYAHVLNEDVHAAIEKTARGAGSQSRITDAGNDEKLFKIKDLG